MKTYKYAILLTGLLLTVPATGNANVAPIIEYDTNYCYAYAMIGEDSVINSRLGLLPENLMELARVKNSETTLPPHYSMVLLRTILDAFMWEKSPQHYARTILHNCSAYENKKAEEVVGLA